MGSVHRYGETLPMAALIGAVFACSAAMAAFAAMLGPVARVLDIAPWSVGIAVASGGLAWMAAAPAWGALADKRGRRWAMLTGLGGFALAFAALCLFLQAALEWALAPGLVFAGLFVGRVLGGLFYAATPIASAALVGDHFAPGTRTAALAALGAGSGLGLVVGPAGASLLASLNLTLPLMGMAIAPFAALILAWRALPRSEIQTCATAPTLKLGDPRLRTPLGIALVSMLCIAAAQLVVGFYALDRLGLTPGAAAVVAGAALGCVGVAMIGAQLLMRKLSWRPRQFICVGAVLASLGFCFALLAETPITFCAAHVLAAFGLGFILPAVQAMAADAAPGHEQGAAAGAVSAAQGLGLTIGPLAGALLYQVDERAPYAALSVLLAVAALFLLRPLALAERA